MSKKKKNSSQTNYKKYFDYYSGKGKAEKLKNAVLQHPDDDDNSIYAYMQKKKKRHLWTVNFEQFQKLGENQNTWDFDWDEVLGNNKSNKWEDLEKDLVNIADKYSDKFGVDSYGIVDAMHQVIDNMFEKNNNK